MSMTNTYPLRLPLSLEKKIVTFAEEDGMTIDQFILVAIAERLATMETVHFFTKRKKQADFDTFRMILNRENTEPPRWGDEIPESYEDLRQYSDYHDGPAEGDSEPSVGEHVLRDASPTTIGA